MIDLPKAFIFGAEATGRSLLHIVSEHYQVIGFIDNDLTSKDAFYRDIPILKPNVILQTDFDVVIIASIPGFRPITKQLLEMGIERHKIVTEYISTPIEARILFLEKLGELFYEKGIEGSCAEGGVFQGDFAKEINRVFFDRKLYLFDTFEGFDEKDVLFDKMNNYSCYSAGYYGQTNEEIVIANLPNPDLCVIRRVFFPQTAEGLENEVFCFVNLDFDLYNPILAGLEFFVPRMVDGGVILIHDYFGETFKGVKEAVNEFINERTDLQIFPVGDGISIGLTKRC